MKRMSAAEKIMEAAWELFSEQGFEDTTIEQILERSKTSRSSFYHHYRGKEELLFTLAYYYDQTYEEWFHSISPSLHTVDKLISFNQFVMKNLEDSEYRKLFPALYAYQVTTSGKRHIINSDRVYFRVLNLIIKEGFLKKEIRSEMSYADITSLIVNHEIGMAYTWVLNQGSYSLVQYSTRLITPFFESLRA